MEINSRRCREKSPDRAKLFMQQPKVTVKPIMKKVQVVYYLTRNGHLEHPHYVEVTHMANHPLRLSDVMERLKSLRGKVMPFLYSWSCKRSYKNGYVWNDLAENDIIYPSDGAEYVLKGSEIVIEEKFQQIQVSTNDHSLHAKPKPSQNRATRSPNKNLFQEHELEVEEEDEEEEEEELDEEKTSYTSSTTSQSRCSRGVSTDELELINSTESTRLYSPPLSSKPTSRRFKDSDPDSTQSPPSRNSVLLQLIACGNMAVSKSKNSQNLNVNNNVKRTSENLHRGVLRKTAAKVAEEDDKEMIRYISENPRFGNLQAEEKEYFSGSIVESMSEDHRVNTESVLKKSNSYNEERNKKSGMERLIEESAVTEMDEEEKREKSMRLKCIPRRKCSSISKQPKNIN